MSAAPEQMLVVGRQADRLTLDSPWLRENADLIEKLLGVLPESLEGLLHFEDHQLRREAFWPHCRLEQDTAASTAGAYRFELVGRTKVDGPTRVVWEQLLYLQGALRRTPEEIDQIAGVHAPVLVFSRAEEYYPLPLGELLAHPTVTASKQSLKVSTVLGDRRVPLPELFDFLRYNGNSQYLLDQSFLSFKKSDFLSLHGDARRAVVYYSYQEDRNSDRFFINYHTFYAFDPKTGIAKLLNVGPHIFDRESMTVVFRGDGQPESVVLSGHLENQTILFLDRLKIWNTGRVRIRHPDPETATVRGHPMAMVAQGSHAIYPCAGLFHVSALSELAGHVFRRIFPMAAAEDEPHEMSENQVLLPPALTADRFSSYELRPLRLDLLQSNAAIPAGPLYDPYTTALVFSGFWVDVPGPSNARFPPFSKREVQVEQWVDEAYEWLWSDLPGGVAANNRAIAEFVESRLTSGT